MKISDPHFSYWHLAYGVACVALFLYNLHAGLVLFGVGMVANGISGISKRQVSFAARGGRRYSYEGSEAVFGGGVSVAVGVSLSIFGLSVLLHFLK